MKKLALIAAALGFAVSVNAQALGPFSALGYDQSTGAGKPGQLTARLPMGENALDLGFGLLLNTQDDGNDDNDLSLGVSAAYLLKLHNWGPVNNYIALGGGLDKLPVANDNIGVYVFGGLQPEVTLLNHIVLATRFGVRLDVVPDVVLATVGDQISVVSGFNFKILF